MLELKYCEVYTEDVIDHPLLLGITIQIEWRHPLHSQQPINFLTEWNEKMQMCANLEAGSTNWVMKLWIPTRIHSWLWPILKKMRKQSTSALQLLEAHTVSNVNKWYVLNREAVWRPSIFIIMSCEIQSTEKELLWQLQALLSKLNSHEELYKANFKQGSVTRDNC